MKLSGPQNSFLMPVSSTTGTREMVRSRYGRHPVPVRGQISPNEKSAGTPVTFHGAQTGSNRPSISPPPSSR